MNSFNLYDILICTNPTTNNRNVAYIIKLEPVIVVKYWSHFYNVPSTYQITKDSLNMYSKIKFHELSDLFKKQLFDCSEYDGDCVKVKLHLLLNDII